LTEDNEASGVSQSMLCFLCFLLLSEPDWHLTAESAALQRLSRNLPTRKSERPLSAIAPPVRPFNLLNSDFCPGNRSSHRTVRDLPPCGIVLPLREWGICHFNHILKNCRIFPHGNNQFE